MDWAQTTTRRDDKHLSFIEIVILQSNNSTKGIRNGVNMASFLSVYDAE